MVETGCWRPIQVANVNDIALQVIQLTDPHLRQDEDGLLLGMNTRRSLSAVLELVQQDGHDPDLVVATGDISQDGSEESYQSFQEYMSVFNCPRSEEHTSELQSRPQLVCRLLLEKNNVKDRYTHVSVYAILSL